MSNILSNINTFERFFEDCFESRFLSQSSIESVQNVTFNGDSLIVTSTGIRQTHVLSLDGTGDFISYGNQQVLDIKTEDFSIEFTINTTDTAGVICGKRSGANNGWIVETAVGLDINFQIDDGTEVSGNNTTALSAGWHHVLISADRSGSATFYIDGVADGTLTISGSTGSLTNSIAFQVGIDGDDASNPLDGDIGFIRFWRDRVIDANEALQLSNTEGF